MSEKIKAILIDDEPYCTQGLEIDLKAVCPEVEVITTCNSAKEGLMQIKKLDPDVVFLDIEMPWMNGFELLELAAPVNFEVIFITAYDQFAVKAFRASAIDYLMKPVDRNLLKEAVSRLSGKLNIQKTQAPKISALIDYIKNPAQSNPKIALPHTDGIDLVLVNDIIYCQADNNYTTIFLTSGKKKLVSKVLKEVASQLQDYDFLRIHQSYLINMEHLVSYHKADGGFVEMINGNKLGVSRAKKRELTARLK